MKLAWLFLGVILPSFAFADAPSWIDHPERRIVGGDIIQWGAGEADSPEVALFKARQAAISKLIEECGGIANKEIIPQKEYVESWNGGNRGYAQVSLEFQACQDAKGPNGPKMENPKISENQRLYMRLMGLQKGSDESKQLQQQIADQLRSSAQVRDEQIGELHNEIAGLRLEMSHVQPQIVAAAPVASGNQMQCRSQYQMMSQQLMTHAQQFNGNVAAPALQGEYSQLMAQRDLCMEMK